MPADSFVYTAQEAPSKIDEEKIDGFLTNGWQLLTISSNVKDPTAWDFHFSRRTENAEGT